MLKKRSFILALVLLLAGAILTACGSKEDNAGGGGTDKEKKDFSVAMVTDTGGVNDKSFNQSAWEGMQRFGKEFGLEKGQGYSYLESQSAADYMPNLTRLVQQGNDLVFGIGYLMQESITKVAQQNSDAHLAIVDAVVDKSNVASITFKEHQGSFLVGVVAGLMTKNNKVGFVGGKKSALITKFEVGFKAGVKAVNPDAKIMIQYAGSFSDAAKGQAIAATMYERGADIIYHASGGTGNGVFTEAKARKGNGQDVWVIGVDRDQYQAGLPENVTLTSMVKRVDNAVFQVSKMAMNGKFPGGEILKFGLKDKGVGIAEHKENLSDKALKKVKEYKKKIINGKIDVPKTEEAYNKYLSNL